MNEFKIPKISINKSLLLNKFHKSFEKINLDTNTLRKFYNDEKGEIIFRIINNKTLNCYLDESLIELSKYKNELNRFNK